MSAKVTSYTMLFQNEDYPMISVLLQRLFAKHGGNIREVAEEIGVHQRTVLRWLAKLDEVGVPDPRGGKRAKMGRKPKAPGDLKSAGAMS